MAEPPRNERSSDSRPESDVRASFVLESKNGFSVLMGFASESRNVQMVISYWVYWTGEWWHAGFHPTTAIVGPPILALPYAFRGLGWGLEFLCLTVMGSVTFFSYNLMSRVLEHCRKPVAAISVSESSPPTFWIMYSSLFPNGSLKLYEFIAMVTVIMIVLSQLPTFHSLKYINLVSLLLSLGYTFLVVGACIHAGTSKNAPPRDYSLENSQSSRVFSAFTSISIIAAIYGNGILPEIQATLAPPVAGKMLKGLLMCYSVIFITFYATAVSGYWVFGNKSGSNILKSLLPDEGPSLAPTWILGLGIIFVLLQLFAIGLVYSQVSFEIMEKKSADTKQGMFSKRNLIPRLILRTMYMIFCGFFAAMLPFFGDISGVVGAVGFIPLDFILPMLLSNITFQKRRSSFTYWINVFIMVVFSGVGLVGSFSTIRKLVLDANKFKLFQ